nr:M15 family metallopeptidase [Spirulina subsalsa]
MNLKPYQQIPIVECHEPLAPIPREVFVLPPIHPYAALGADYQGRSPYFLRQGVIQALEQAQQALQGEHPQWKILIFDAFRPISVQQFMVDYSFQTLLQQRGLTEAQLSEGEKQDLWQVVYELWALPSSDPATPPPHSTGAALDITLVDAQGNVVDMGSEIDELSARSHPDYYASAQTPPEQTYHQHRQLLHRIMTQAGFRRHPREWWHFSLGDQLWAWLGKQDDPGFDAIARYGRV